ncbi:MAG: 8-oxoguanine DNA glycosylase, partial [Candidatus Eisenbacteria bacterium]|nr:8-oxoguanine DNA glycosylase [Candidatus Eisenbacteria bacterium]
MRIDAPDLHLEATLESGQVFGYARQKDGAYRGVLRGKLVTLRSHGAVLSVSGAVLPTAREVRDYLDLDRDLGHVYAHLETDPRLHSTLSAYRGLRLIRQDPWEALACFILSSNNNVKRIQLIHDQLAARLGGGAFPKAEAIARCHERTLREMGLGYRAPFLQRSATYVANNPHALESIRTADFGAARELVSCYPGIGPKVADCVLLYGFARYEAFPVDVWMLRVMRNLYFNR